MGITSRELLLDNLVTALTSIDGSGDFKTTVSKVERRFREWSDVGIGEMPWLGYKTGVSEAEHQPNSFIRVRLPVTVIGHVNVADPELTEAALSDLEDDVIAAVNLDTTRGGNAVQTTWLGSEADENHPDRQDHRGGSGTIRIELQVLYERTTRSTT